MNTKSIFKSKTMAVNAIVLFASFFPSVASWVQGHPTETMQVLAASSMVLRLVTKGKVQIIGD